MRCAALSLAANNSPTGRYPTRDPFDRRAKRAIESRNIELVGISFEPPELRLVVIPDARILAGFQSRLLDPRRRGSAVSFIPARGLSPPLSLSLSLSVFPFLPFSRGRILFLNPLTNSYFLSSGTSARENPGSICRNKIRNAQLERPRCFLPEIGQGISVWHTLRVSERSRGRVAS